VVSDLKFVCEEAEDSVTNFKSTTLAYTCVGLNQPDHREWSRVISLGGLLATSPSTQAVSTRHKSIRESQERHADKSGISDSRPSEGEMGESVAYPDLNPPLRQKAPPAPSICPI
jgi:hypothetical protein